MAPHAVAFEVRGEDGRRLWLDASRRAAGAYLVGRNETAAIEERDAGALPGRDRHALLLLRKHVDGRRVSGVARPADQRAIVLELSGPRLALRLSGTPALSLILDDAAVATLGEGAPAWPLRAASEPPARPSAEAPRVFLPASLSECHDRDLVETAVVGLGTGVGLEVRPASWLEAAALYLVARRRGARFASAQAVVLGEARRSVRRLARLESNLEQDLSGLPDAEGLRRQGEALLAAPQRVPAGAAAADVPDPYAEGRTIHVVLDPRLGAPANADRLFAKARRIDRARGQVRERLGRTRSDLAEARAAEARALAARDLPDLTARGRQTETEASPRGPRHYLTSRGLSILVGRGARENHHLTFAVAKPEDVWLHARDVPGSHVIVRDPEGRAGVEDLREAAELAAFFSDAGAEARVDVHVTRRKHVRPARGGPGRVQIFHSDTLRVAPRDPEGRLRRRRGAARYDPRRDGNS